MSNQELDQFSPEEVLESAQGNFNALAFVTMAYLKQHGLSPVDYWRFIGARFAESWSPGMNALEMAEGAAINWISGGAKLVEITGDETHSELVLSGWPLEDFLEMFETKLEDADTMLEIMRPIAEHLGFDYQWKREDERIRQVYTRK